MIQILTLIWYVSFALLLGYHLFVFRSRKKQPAVHTWSELPGVSIVVAVKNGSKNLADNLNTFHSQDYPVYEIIIVNDHSTPEETTKLEALVHDLPNVTLLHSVGLPGKKQALTMGIEKAKFDLILCTDADCNPSTPQWISSMVAHTSRHELVLGYSPYAASKGLLNIFVRFETIMTAIQYFSWAMTGRPYMGVGRNMMYTRKIFQQVNPYQNNQTIPYGDDDLWVQQAAEVTSVGVNLDPASFVFSAPPVSWKQWFRQKRRHLSAGHHYSNTKWWQPGLYGIALILHWSLLAAIVPVAVESTLFVLFCLGLAIRWDTYRRWSAKLSDKGTAIAYPFFEVGYALYLAGMGLITLIAKKKTWN